ncbi:MAG: peptidylprolyl isomerase [Nitrospirota bacterium]|nr:peptidylprolyl isomerase [Nitrospirota bacterium]
MAEDQSPKEPEKTIYQRDKTAKEPVQPTDTPKAPVRPKIKPKKAFVAKKLVLKTGKPMEYRTRHIRLSAVDAAELIRQTLLDFQKELAEMPMNDPDKEYHDREKVEKFFAKLAKKYSNCSSKGLGGDLGWIYKGINVTGSLLTENLVETILNTGSHTIPAPVKTELGIHLILICESQVYVPKIKADSGDNPASIPEIPN